MSILIKGMEMPSNCAECPLNHDAECTVKNCMVIDDCYVRRASWCPLVSVPPHGRLIDVDAPIRLEIKIDGGMNMCVTDIYAPTVIEAEEGET